MVVLPAFPEAMDGVCQLYEQSLKDRYLYNLYIIHIKYIYIYMDLPARDLALSFGERVWLSRFLKT